MFKNQELLVNKNYDYEREHLNSLKELYFKKEKNYLEVLYFQILRNSKADNFDEYCLMNLFSFSEFLNSRIFKVLSKNKETLKLNGFIFGINLLFSKFLPRSGKQLTEMIFDLISNNTESISYQLIKEFANNLIFDCFNNAQIYEFEFFIIFSKNLSRLIKFTFSIGLKYNKFYKFCKNEFLTITEKNPLFISILILLLNLLSPINENLILKLYKPNNIVMFNNDDFENEFEFEFENTPRINSFPKENTLNFQNNRLINCLEKKYFNPSSECFNNELSFGNNNKINDFNYNLNNKNKSLDASFESIDEDENNNYYNIFKKETFSTNKNIKNSNNLNYVNKINNRESYLEEVSTDISGAIGFRKNENTVSVDLSVKSPTNTENEKTNLKNKICDFSNFLNKVNYKYSDVTMKEETFETSKINILKSSKNKCKNISEIDYLFTNNQNEIFPSKDLRLLKFEEKDMETINNMCLLYNEFKKFPQKINNKIKVLFRKTPSLNFENDINKIPKYNTVDLYNSHNEDKTLPFKVKFIGNDLLINNIPLNDHSKAFKKKAHIKNSLLEEFLLQKMNYLDKEKYYIYFYNLKNIILLTLPLEDKCEFTFILGEVKFKYFCLEFIHIKQRYQLFFESYEQLVNFHNTLQKKLMILNRPFFLNARKEQCNFGLLQKYDFIFKKRKQFSVFHKLVEKNLNVSIKVQTFDKSMLSKENYLLFKKIHDTFKINNFLNLKIFPIANFYESENHFILEYTNDNFRIKYNANSKNFVIFMNNCENKDILLLELGKLLKLVKLLEYNENISTVFDLIDFQKIPVFIKN